MLVWGLARQLPWHSSAYNPHWLKAACIRPVACSPPGPPPTPMPRRMLSLGSDTRHRARVWHSVSLSIAQSFWYIYSYLFLFLFFKQSLLYGSQFNISIRTWVISTVFASSSSLELSSLIALCSIGKEIRKGKRRKEEVVSGFFCLFYFCFNHTVFTLLRVWQPPNPLSSKWLVYRLSGRERMGWREMV
jgi:hypothetical protein